MKINKSFLLKFSSLFMITVLFIILGVSVPALFIRLKSSEDNLPRGEVDIAKIQPYGVEALENENTLIELSYAYNRYYFTTSSDLRTINKNEGFRELGIEQRRYSEGSVRRNEFFYEVISLIDSSFECETTLSYRAENVSCQTGYELIHVYDDSSDIYIDPSTGIPVYASIRVITSSDSMDNKIAIDNLCVSIISLYSEYSEIQFVHEEYAPSYSSDGNYDSTYSRMIYSADDNLGLSFDITSGWFWLPPNNSVDYWQETDSYVWTVQFSLYSPETK